jgi:hypothetical protein
VAIVNGDAIGLKPWPPVNQVVCSRCLDDDLAAADHDGTRTAPIVQV